MKHQQSEGKIDKQYEKNLSHLLNNTYLNTEVYQTLLLKSLPQIHLVNLKIMSVWSSFEKYFGYPRFTSPYLGNDDSLRMSL